jgi:pyruvate-formate lyase-activating enzyme
MDLKELRNIYSSNNLNIQSIESINPDYELALLTYYTVINNKVNKLQGDEQTLNEVKNIVDEEMGKIVGMLNCRVLTIDTTNL